jgi:hypothetical protein
MKKSLASFRGARQVVGGIHALAAVSREHETVDGKRRLVPQDEQRFMAKVRNEMQAPSREDMDSIMLSVRHMETRILDRVEELSAQIHALKNGASKSAKSHGGHASTGAKARPRRKTKR